MLEPNQPKSDIKFRGVSRKGPIIGVLLILIAIAGYTFFTRGLSAEVSGLKADISSTVVSIEEFKVKLAEFEQAEEELGLATEVQRRETLKSIPSEMDQDDVIRDVVNIAEGNEIELNSISFGQGSTDEVEVGALRINASFEGNYNDLINFLRGIEQNARFLRVSSISVQINKVDVLDILRANFSLSMEAYFQQ